MDLQNDRLNHLLAELIERSDQGYAIDVENVIENHPDLGGDVLSFLEMEQLVGEALRKARTPSASTESTINCRITPPPGYSIVCELGRGGMGVVYGAIDLSLGRRVAIKALPQALANDSARIARFRQEAVAASRLTSSRVLSVFDVCEHHGCLFIVSPWIEGSDLARVLRQRRAKRKGDNVKSCHGLCEVDDVAFLAATLRMCDQMLEALVAIHCANVIHRDIKPSNILIDNRGDIWLADFGLAKIVDQQGMTISGDILGTRGYMSPEQLKGASIDFRADVFSLGVTVYEALTERLPFESSRTYESSPLAAPLTQFQRNLSSDFDAVVLKAIDPSREHRYDTARQFQDDWMRVRQGLLPCARRPSIYRRAGRWISRRRWLVATGTLGTACMGLMIGMLPATPLRYQVILPTSPPATRGILVPIDQDSGDLRPSDAICSAANSGKGLVFNAVPPGDYFVAVEGAGGTFHEVFRRVPLAEESPVSFRHRDWTRIAHRTVRLHEVVIPPVSIAKQMVQFDGATAFRVGVCDPPMAAYSLHDREIRPFLIDSREVTYLDCDKMRLGHLLPTGDFSDLNRPMSNLTFDQAVEYAELMGKRLPTEFEYEYCVTNAGTSRYPWGEDRNLATSNSFGLRGLNVADRTRGDRSVFGLFSGVAEWTSSWGTPYPTAPKEVIEIFRQHPDFRQLRIVRGGPSREVSYEPLSSIPEISVGPRYRVSLYRSDHSPHLGFRCARSVRPQFLKD